MKMQILLTPRLELQPQTVVHSDRLFDLFQDKELYSFITRTPPKSRDEFRERLRFLEGRQSRDGLEYWMNWVSVLRMSGEIIGQIEVSMQVESRELYLAYYVFRSHWKQGYAKEGCAAIIDHMFTSWGATKVIIEMDVRNNASFRLAESLGAKRVAFKPKTQFLKGEWSDEYQYEILPPNKPPEI
jgi:RimJ/RimL family protein N-acetyltransferase